MTVTGLGYKKTILALRKVRQLVFNSTASLSDKLQRTFDCFTLHHSVRVSSAFSPSAVSDRNLDCQLHCAPQAL
jgi:hypothetical protein